MKNTIKEVSFRTPELVDVSQILIVEEKAWGKDGAANRDQIISRLSHFPEGNLVCEFKGEIIGFGTMTRVKLDWEKHDFTWAEVTSDGYIKENFDPKGDVFYGVDLSIDPAWQENGLAYDMMHYMVDLGKKIGCLWFVAGARMPGYDEYCKKNGDISPEDYIDLKKESDKPFDDQLSYYNTTGFQLIRPLPNYFPDPESRDYGVLAVINLSI